MSEDEDILENPFFIDLKKKFASYHAEIERACHMLLVPTSSSIIGTEITRELIESHIFHQDPQVETKYTCVYDPSKVIEVSGGQIRLLRGFESQSSSPASTQTSHQNMNSNTLAVHHPVSSSFNRSASVSPRQQQPHQHIDILFEEMFYNRKAEPYRVICIAHATTGRSMQLEELSKLSDIKTYKQAEDYLFSNAINALVLSKIERSDLVEFITEYTRKIPTEFEMASRTSQLVDSVVEALRCANTTLRDLGKHPAALRQLEIIVETWVLGRVGATVMNALMHSFELVDREIHRVLLANQGLTLHNLNLRPELICDYSNAIELVSLQFDKVCSPVEKLMLMQSVIETIQQSIEYSFAKSSKNGLHSQNGDNVITSDDLIPIIVFVLLQAKPRHLNAQLFYVKHFTRSNLKTSQMGFHLVTFTAAVEFIKTDHLPHSGFSISNSPGDIVAHPLDPVRSPRFDPFAAGIQEPPTQSNRELHRRSTSYITPPVTSTISTGRSFGSKSSNPSRSSVAYGSTTSGHGFQGGYTSSYASSNQYSDRPSINRSISSYDYSSSSVQQQPRKTNYGSLGTSPALSQESTHQTSDSSKRNTPGLVSNNSGSAAPEVITLSAAQTKDFFSNLKNFATSSSKSLGLS